MAYIGPHSTLPPDDPLRRGQPGRNAWDTPGRVGEPALREYIRAEASLFKQGPVPLPIFEERKAACLTCRGRDPAGDELGFCTKCGCGDRERARLSVKLHMPATSCPLPGAAKRWGEAEGEGRHALSRLPGGIRGQALSVVKAMGKELKRRLRLRKSKNPKGN